MNVAMFISVGLGYIGGVVAAFYIGRRIMAVFTRGARIKAAQRRTVMRLAVAGGLVALLPALFLGTVVGGSLGGAYGEVIFRSLGAGSAGIVPGIALGMFAVVACLICLAIAIGAIIGRLIAHERNAAV